MQDFDLPEPVRRPFTEKERKDRHWRLLRVGMYAAVCYAMVHKVAVPLFLSTTALAGTPFARVDPWAVHSLLLALVLSDRWRGSGVASLLAGMGIVYGIYETYEVLDGRVPGWLAISRLISSVPIAVGSGLLLNSSAFGRRPGWAWAGAAGLAFILALVEGIRSSHGF